MLWSLAARAGIPAARSALRFISKLKKPSGGGITLYRGEPVVSKHAMSLKDMAKAMYTKDASRYTVLGDLGNPALRRGAAGRWFSTKPSSVTGYAGSKVYSWKPKDWANIINWGGGYKKGVVKKLTLTPKELKLAKKLQQKVSGHDISHFYIAPKSALPRVEKDAILTAVANLKNMLGIYKHGGLARILEV
jgi:hypothetical protein